MPQILKTETRPVVTSSLTILSLSALGVVFGDIGTSPLYTFKTVLALAGNAPDVRTILGSLSLIIWTLIMIVSVKYVNVAMRIGNDGEGGILALMSLFGVKLRPRPIVIAVGLMGAALIYGDGAITPAISVLSALEGLNMISPSFEHYILPAAVTILLILFAIQPKGTLNIGKAFGPVMALWFLTIGILGVCGVIKHPAILVAINPMYGLTYLFSNGIAGFLVLGGVFLCVTGAEALYADMGHFGSKSIRLVWSWLVFPSLALNYAGQAALVLEGVSTKDNIFYLLCPKGLLLPLVLLATAATIIASQSIITGAFSMTRQAIQLGWLPRFRITQTSSKGYGQIYVGIVNWLLMFATVGLTIGFGKSNHLASAYGIAVSATMLMTSMLLFIAMRELWNWNLWQAGAVASLFILIDAAFFTANLSKFAEGGYIPIIFAVVIYSLMHIWHKGVEAVSLRLKVKAIPIDTFIEQITKDGVPRVAKTAVFLTRTAQDTPPVMIWHVKQNHVLPSQLFILQVNTQSIPWCKSDDRLEVKEIAANIWRAVAHYGFMEQPNIPKLLEQVYAEGHNIKLNEVTYYVGHETIIPRDDVPLMPRYIEYIFAFMHRNALPISDYLRLPPDSVVEIGRQIEI